MPIVVCNSRAARPDYWRLGIETATDGDDFSLNIAAGTTIDIDVDWGDGGAVENFTSTGVKVHQYTTAGSYEIRISGSFASGGNIRCGDTDARRARLKSTGIVNGITGLGNFDQTFYGCSGLTALPVDLFRYNTAVSARGFYSTFYKCTGLTSVPADLFRYNTAVSTNGFYGTFNGCTGLTSLPVDLFRYNTAVSTSGFSYAFYGCNKLQLNANVFFAAGESGTRFLNRVSNFASCMRLTAAFGGTQGTAPALWGCDFGTETPTTTSCFTGHSADSVSNYADIPTAWGGAA